MMKITHGGIEMEDPWRTGKETRRWRQMKEAEHGDALGELVGDGRAMVKCAQPERSLQTMRMLWRGETRDHAGVKIPHI